MFELMNYKRDANLYMFPHKLVSLCNLDTLSFIGINDKIYEALLFK